MTDDHLPAPNQWCDVCESFGTHCWCKETDLDICDVNPLVALHDAVLAVEGEAA